ncbi:MAG: hypothetical protein KatS3mg008_1053 [Acidimicrobiales bacterium]|nr:MAG: hypothetical protein KatS3mg008_1053 [Acidimicrobiales bacterium]
MTGEQTAAGSWLLAWSAGCGDPAGFALLVHRPEPVVRIGLVTPLGLCVVHEDELTPSRYACEFRGPVVWLALLEEEPSARWTAGLETYGLLVPGRRCRIHGDLRGERVPVGYDLEVQAVQPVSSGDAPADTSGGADVVGLRQSAAVRVKVTGELAVGAETWDVEAAGFLAVSGNIGPVARTSGSSAVETSAGGSGSCRRNGRDPVATFELAELGNAALVLHLREVLESEDSPAPSPELVRWEVLPGDEASREPE